MSTSPAAPFPPSADVAELAQAFGVATEYYTQQGEHRIVAGDTLARVLAALHVDVTTETGRAAAWDRVTNGPWRRILPPVVVTRQGHDREFLVHLPDGAAITLWIDLEHGERHPLPHPTEDQATRDVDGRLMRDFACAVPTDLPLGWHRSEPHSRVPAAHHGGRLPARGHARPARVAGSDARPPHVGADDPALRHAVSGIVGAGRPP